MRLVGFQGRWVAPILDGVKTSTIRSADAPLPRVGETVGLRCRYDRPPFAHAVIVDVHPVDPATLTDDDAHADGFPDVRTLRNAVTDMYGQAPVARIIFRLVATPEEPGTLF